MCCCERFHLRVLALTTALKLACGNGGGQSQRKTAMRLPRISRG